ncbi:hypothetical protein TCAL_10824 [Tigriopus californicus]|uniref:ER-bound oxygenase mpaB/mpaB'/Rubber oxygenase catalytic domain-containing protein n=1 Tax=Tigriopus californicus TaxID=6832 RepID=A0A553NCJ6_TIGCA|nr:uncharacterized protein LOC131887737 [Tigriopus californicus]TRY63164.1 hypothetical protein TCAL_10824 [Tigriopus californicus]|eukprot:TCALIF_10824-PA protein Name:"Protein of unknown function" AED:0.08 eAED:0.08 QI:0/-1/0/1/-1/1/1/0/342
MCRRGLNDKSYTNNNQVKFLDHTKYEDLFKRAQQHTHDVESQRKTKEDPEMLARAGELFQSHILSMFTSMMAGLLSLMFVPSIVNVLSTTRKSETPIKAFNRYLSTLNHVLEWYKSPMERLESLKKVRHLHTKANAVALNNQGVGMTQFDMLVTQWAFVGPIFIIPERVGIRAIGAKDLEALAHFWYLIGFYLGVKDEFNLCVGSVEEIQQFSRAILTQVIKPSLESPDTLKRNMADSLLIGINLLNPLVFPKAFLCFIFKMYEADIFEQYQKRPKEFLGTFTLDSLMYRFMCWVFDVLFHIRMTNGIMRWIVNALMRLDIYLANYLKLRTIRVYKKAHKID